jgi:NAD(P)-dependent dehydrogenase (short-subunit alcohol dehydrogenase family)
MSCRNGPDRHDVRTLALGPRSIRVNGIAPGVTEPPMIDNYFEGTRRAQMNAATLGRIGSASEIADAGCLLISDASRYIFGEMVIGGDHSL